MSHSRFRMLSRSGFSCVRLPVTVAFPTDAGLLDRIERSRKALPPNSIKPLWRSGGSWSAASAAPATQSAR